MSLKVVLLVLSLSLLGLGAAQECEGVVGVLGMTPDQLKKEIRATVAAALKHNVNLSSGNETNLHEVPSQNRVNTTLEKAVDVVIEIDDLYFDGISLTHGHDPRKHIWTFAVAIHEVLTSDRENICPCTNIHNPLSLPTSPYVGVTTSVTLPVKQPTSSSSTPMIPLGWAGLWSTEHLLFLQQPSMVHERASLSN